MAEERNENEFTRDQGVAIQSLVLAIQTVREGFLRFKGDSEPETIRNYVLVTADAYRDFINDRVRSARTVERLKAGGDNPKN